MADKLITFEEAYKFAKDAGSKFPAVVAAQYANESAWGQKQANAKNNLFNIKWNDAAAKKLKARGVNVTKGSKPSKDNTTGSMDYYMAFDSIADAFSGYQNFIETNPRYKTALDSASNNEYLRELKKAGYAESPSYVADIERVMNPYSKDWSAINEEGNSSSLSSFSKSDVPNLSEEQWNTHMNSKDIHESNLTPQQSDARKAVESVNKVIHTPFGLVNSYSDLQNYITNNSKVPSNSAGVNTTQIAPFNMINKPSSSSNNLENNINTDITNLKAGNGYNLNDYSLNSPQMSPPQFMGMNNNTPTTANTGFKDLMGTAAGQAGAYGLASGMLNLIPALSDLNKFKKTDPLNTQFQRAQTPEDIEAIKISESQLDPTYNSSLNKTRKDIINLSGGSGAVARANIAGANISNARAKAASLIGIINQNKQQQQSVDKYNAQTRSRIDQLNTGISNKEIEANEQNQAAYNSQLNQYKQTLRQGTSDTMADTLKLFMNMNTTGYGFNGKLKG